MTSNTPSHIVLLFVLEFLIGLFLNLCMPALYVETQQTLDAMEKKTPGVFGPKGAVAQGFGIQTMAQFLGLFCGPIAGGFVEYQFGWGAMTGCLAGLGGGTALMYGIYCWHGGCSTYERVAEDEDEDEGA